MKRSSVYLIAKVFSNGNAQGWQPSQEKASLRPHERAYKMGQTSQTAILQNVPILLKVIIYPVISITSRNHTEKITRNLNKDLYTVSS